MDARLEAQVQARTEANGEFFARESEHLARLCHAMAERFARGGRLIASGGSPTARSDARHVAVEFVHPVIVGKRALPAIGLAAEGGSLPAQVELLVRPDDIVIAFGAASDVADAAAVVQAARVRGCLTIAFARIGADWEFEPPTGDRYVAQELVETLYHVLWELVHVFFEHRGLLEGRTERRTHDAGASSFLYPFLDERESALEPVLEDVRRSVLMKADEIGALREQTLTENRDDPGRSVRGAAPVLRPRREAAGARQRRLGDRRDGRGRRLSRAASGGPARPAIDLTEDSGILTAIANDIGVDAIFSRQVIAYGSPGDVLLSLSTSGNSGNVIEALAEARRRGLVTIAMVGYDGGRIGSERLADHVVITRSEHIPRIQEAQASAYHVLRELVELGRRIGRDERGHASSRTGPRRGHRAGCRLSAVRLPAGRRAGIDRVRAQRLPRRPARGRGSRRRGRDVSGAPRSGCAAAGGGRERDGRVAREPTGDDGFEIRPESAWRARRRSGDAGQRDLRRLPARAARPGATGATATRSSTAPTAVRGSRSCAASPTTAR